MEGDSWGQELSGKKRTEVGLEYRSPNVPIRLLFYEPVSLYTCRHMQRATLSRE